MGFSDDSDGKESACKVGDLGLIPGLGRSPGEGHSNPLQYCLENPHGQRSLVGYSPSGRKESDPTEQLSTHTQWAGVHVVTLSTNKSPRKDRDWFVHPCVSSPQDSAQHVANA